MITDRRQLTAETIVNSLIYIYTDTVQNGIYGENFLERNCLQRKTLYNANIIHNNGWFAL